MSKERTIRIILYFFTSYHCLNILMSTIKCTYKSSSICMTARDDTDELKGDFVKQPYVLHSIKFKCMSLYEYVYVRASVKLYILHEGTYIRVSTISVPTVLQVAFKRFVRFRKFRLVISSTRGVMFDSFTHCLHFVGHWQTVLIQIRRHITKKNSS